MSKITPQNLSPEEFPEQQDWISKLFSPLNQFTREVVRAFSNGFSVEDNLFQEIKELGFTAVDGTYPLKFKCKFAVNPRGLTPIYLLNKTTGAYSEQAPWVRWSYADGQIIISDITGMIASNQYIIRLLIVYG